MAGEISLEATMLDDVNLDPYVDLVTVIPESPIRLPGFGLDAFFAYQLLEASCPLNAPLHVGSSSSVEVISINFPYPTLKHKRLLTPHQFEHFLREVSQGPRRMSSFPSDHTVSTLANM